MTPAETAWQKHARELRAARVRSREAFAHIDFDTFVKQVKALPIFKDCPRSIKKTEVCIVYTTGRYGGWAHGNRFVRICLSAATGVGWALETIVHELVHSALPEHTSHNERFRRTLARAARELWGIDVNPNPKADSGRTPCYALDYEIERVLGGALEIGWLTYPKRAPVEAPTLKEIAAAAHARRAALSAKRAALVEKRAAHATKMRARAEARLKAAQRLATKWRARERYYERVAAKKGNAS